MASKAMRQILLSSLDEIELAVVYKIAEELFAEAEPDETVVVTYYNLLISWQFHLLRQRSWNHPLVLVLLPCHGHGKTLSSSPRP